MLRERGVSPRMQLTIASTSLRPSGANASSVMSLCRSSVSRKSMTVGLASSPRIVRINMSGLAGADRARCSSSSRLASSAQ